MSSICTKEEYVQYTEEYVNALEKSMKATAAYEIAKHKTRLKLYAKKAAGEKYTEEQIRTMSIVENEELYIEYMNASCRLEKARSVLECMKNIYNKEDK